MGLKNFGQMPLHFAAIRYLQESVDGAGVAENAAHLDIWGPVKHQDEFMLTCHWDHVGFQRKQTDKLQSSHLLRIQ